MFNIAHHVRTKHTDQFTAKAILEALKEDAFDDIIIASGWFQESENFRISDEVITALSFRTKSLKLTIIGGYNTDCQQAAARIVARIKDDAISSLISVNLRHKDYWHAKVMMASREGVPVFTVHGSSNMTNPALFGTEERFNIESDVAMWLDEVAAARTLGMSLCDNQNEERLIFTSSYLGSPPMSEKLMTLREQLLRASND